MTLARKIWRGLPPFTLLLLMLAGVYLKLDRVSSSLPWGVIRDDGRHFVSWLRKLADPALFQNDPIAA